MIATSTLLSYDVYRHYFVPKATSQQVVTASRVFIVFWAVFSGSLSSIFYAVGIVSIFFVLQQSRSPYRHHNRAQNLGWLFYFLGVATASGSFPIALAFL